MKHRTINSIAAIAIIILASCMGKEERTICDYLNSKLTAAAEKVTDVEIISQDSVLSIVPIQWTYTDFLRTRNDSILVQLSECFSDAVNARNYVLAGTKKPAELLSKYPHEWRRIVKVSAKGDNGRIRDNIEVIFDNDNITPMSLGREYDQELSMWDLKINALKY